MAPSDARAAFVQGKIDAWVTWDPYLALVEKNMGARVLRDGKGISTQGGFYMASKTFVSENPKLVRVILEEIDKLGKWADKNPHQVA
jgi:sulfonate transport system substrate-binding protein